MTIITKAILSLCVLASTGILTETMSFAQNRASGRNRQNNARRIEGAIEAGVSTSARIFVLRLKPGQDLREELEKLTKASNIRAGFIVTAVGSLQKASLRLADQTATSTFMQKFEIVSLTGTLSTDGVHLHIALSDTEGKTIGGHLVSGSIIYTTAEIVIAEARDLFFTREMDAQTGYKELKVHKRVRAQRR
ncbi:MAG TPA: PPC domain-containing DNA-binding protein [Pyrinomonadaceae bacterium]|jgi:predicted DNA-binding protein with PD1-like motif|nr:PPC domain-containing DNA-binding protein [Pyrinomonadaceae bacterium]